MTVIIFQVTDDRVAVLTDTMACDVGGELAFLVDKCDVVPHLNLALAVNGYADLVKRLVELLRTSLPVRDIDTLNEIAPAVLCDLWEQLEPVRPIGREDDRTTLYVFGVSEDDGMCRGYAYKSENGFEPQPVPVGAVGISPVPSFDDYDVSTLEEWIDLACRLRHDGADGRVVIGGDLMLTMLAPGSTSITKVHRFEDHDEQRERLERSCPMGAVMSGVGR